MASNPIPICPKCKQADQVQKVTQVYDSNTEEWYEEEYGTDNRGRIETRRVQHEAHTKLGFKLKPPEEPTPPGNPRLWYWIGIGIAVIVLLALCPFVVAPLAIVIPILLANSSTLPPGLSNLGRTTLAVGIGAVLLISGLIVLGVLLWLGFMVKRHYDRDMAKYRDKEAAYERDELWPYQRSLARWEQLYYCRRDAIVFMPSENKAVPVEDIEKYLHDPYYQV